MKCIRKGCHNEAVIDRVFGVLPCEECQRKDASRSPYRKFQFANLSQADRVQHQRDKHVKDLLQPYDRGRANPDFFKAYPERIDDYGVRQELEKS